MMRHASALMGAIVLAIAVPWIALNRQTGSPALPLAAADEPLRPAAPVPIDAVMTRDPFEAGAAPAEASQPGDEADAPPQIVGIAGRLPDRAVVLVRRAEGGTRTLAVGEAIGRWRLVSIGADAALFVDGARRARVELPPADPAQ